MLKTASKNWDSLISKDHKFHLKQSSSSSSASKNLILYPMDVCREGSEFRYADIDTCESRKVIVPVEIAESCGLIGSANRLICLASICEGRGDCFVWNPCTGKCKSISLPFPVTTRFTYRKKGPSYTKLFGFGYDSTADDYKILGHCDYSRIRMLSLKTNSWKILDFSVKCPYNVCAFYSNGALRWWYEIATRHLTAFHLANEKIFFLELPEEMKFMSLHLLPLFNHQGSLCTVGRGSIWMMKEYGYAKSWTKLSTLLECLYVVPKGISRLGEVVYRTIDGLGFVKSDIQGRISEDNKSRLLSFPDIFAYNESLISPKYSDPK